jgi:hypothetical protein
MLRDGSDEENRLTICDSQPAQQGAFCVCPQFFADRMVWKGPLQKFSYIHLRKPPAMTEDKVSRTPWVRITENQLPLY